MSQILGIGQGKFLTFDRSWRDNGQDATYALVGGQKVLVSGATKAKPEIFQRGAGFYYRDGTPVDNLEDVSYLPTKYRYIAEKFVRENSGAAEPLKPVVTKEEAVEQAVKRGRGRPKKTVPNAPLKIEDEMSLRSITGDEA